MVPGSNKYWWCRVCVTGMSGLYLIIVNLETTAPCYTGAAFIQTNNILPPPPLPSLLELVAYLPRSASLVSPGLIISDTMKSQGAQHWQVVNWSSPAPPPSTLYRVTQNWQLHSSIVLIGCPALKEKIKRKTLNTCLAFKTCWYFFWTPCRTSPLSRH